MSTVIAALIIVSGGGVGVQILVKKLDIIHDLVNSTLTKAQTDLAVAERRIETLEAHIVGVDKP